MIRNDLCLDKNLFPTSTKAPANVKKDLLDKDIMHD